MNDDRPFFRQTQNAGGLLFVGLAALLAIMVALVSSPGEPLLFGLGLGIAVALLALHSVQIGVDDEALTVRLGVGLIRWRVELKDITSVTTLTVERMGGLPLRREADGWVVGFGQGEGGNCVDCGLEVGAADVVGGQSRHPRRADPDRAHRVDDLARHRFDRARCGRARDRR